MGAALKVERTLIVRRINLNINRGKAYRLSVGRAASEGIKRGEKGTFVY